MGDISYWVAIVGRGLAIGFVFGVLATAALGQTPCLTSQRSAALAADLAAHKFGGPDAALRDEILKMKADLGLGNAVQNTDQTAAQKQVLATRLCAILADKPWPGKTLVGADGSAAWIAIIKTVLDIATQRALIPVIAAAADAGETAQDPDLAALIDHIRLRSGLTQIFGSTAVGDKKGFLVLWPLLSTEHVDEWRKQYGLGSLHNYLLALQYTYKMPLIMSTSKPAAVPVSAAEAKASSGGDLRPTGANDDVVRVSTSFVKLDVTAYGTDIPELKKEDLKVYEDDQPQEITQFSAPDAPYDIVLLLDMSGSTANQVGLIKKTTKDFVEMKRDADRVSIVEFTNTPTVVSPLEKDKKKLLSSVGKIKDYGGTSVFDAEKFAVDMLNAASGPERRRAVVVMSDGVDNFFTYFPNSGSETLFADLVEEVRNSEVEIFPIYLDTERGHEVEIQREYEDARRTMKLLADESGGNYYTSKDVGDLSAVYARISKDIGRVYTIGYEPKDERRDGRWRTLRVEVVGHPEIKVRFKPGYYAK